MSEEEKKVLDHIKNQIESLQEYIGRVEKEEITFAEFLSECDIKGYQIQTAFEMFEED